MLTRGIHDHHYHHNTTEWTLWPDCFIASSSFTIDFQLKNQIALKEEKFHNHFYVRGETGSRCCCKGGDHAHAWCSADPCQHFCLSEGCALGRGVAVLEGWHQEKEEKLRGTGSKALMESTTTKIWMNINKRNRIFSIQGYSDPVVNWCLWRHTTWSPIV